MEIFDQDLEHHDVMSPAATQAILDVLRLSVTRKTTLLKIVVSITTKALNPFIYRIFI